jgi:hypothetical protein
MLSSKARILWIKWHAYLSCFFLPLALIFALTGLLHLLEVKGGASETFEFPYSSNSWPNNEKDAKQALQFLLKQEGGLDHLPFPKNYFVSSSWQGWYDIHQEISLVAEDEDHGAKVVIEKNDLMRQLMYIHKGIASNIFVILGVLLALSLLFSIISGAIVALAMPKLKKNASIACALGSLTVLIAYLAS